MNLDSGALFMLDIETTGLDEEKDDILQIASLRLEWDETTGLFVPNNHHSILLPTCKEPSEFAKKNPAQLKLYEKCHNLHQQLPTENTPSTSAVEYASAPDVVRRELTTFLGPKAPILGLNVTTFDLRFLEKKGYLFKSDYHYQVFDVTGVIEYLLRLFRLPRDRATRDAIKAKAKALGSLTVKYPDDVGPHEGVYDCYDQTAELNGFLIAGRQNWSGLT